MKRARLKLIMQKETAQKSEKLFDSVIVTSEGSEDDVPVAIDADAG